MNTEDLIQVYGVQYNMTYLKLTNNVVKYISVRAIYI